MHDSCKQRAEYFFLDIRFCKAFAISDINADVDALPRCPLESEEDSLPAGVVAQVSGVDCEDSRTIGCVRNANIFRMVNFQRMKGMLSG